LTSSSNKASKQGESVGGGLKKTKKIAPKKNIGGARAHTAQRGPGLDKKQRTVGTNRIKTPGKKAFAPKKGRGAPRREEKSENSQEVLTKLLGTGNFGELRKKTSQKGKTVWSLVGGGGSTEKNIE